MATVYKALIFDCDGTLADTMPLHFVTWQTTMKAHGIAFPQDLFYAWAGEPAYVIIQRLARQAGVQLDIDAAVAEKERLFYKELKHVKAIKPVLEIARENRGRIPMAVASGGLRHTVEQTLRQLDVLNWFDAIVTAEDVENHKPAPDVFLEAARRMQISPADCCAYEDADLGLQSIRAAGMNAVDIRLMLEDPKICC